MRRNMSNNAISGPLPANWGFGDVFTQLQIITLENNKLSGNLPTSYNQGLKSLIVFNLGNNDFSGVQQLQCSSQGLYLSGRTLNRCPRDRDLSSCLSLRV